VVGMVTTEKELPGRPETCGYHAVLGIPPYI
jgi:hypothetical protein